MRIGIDARMYFQSGIGRYLRNLLEQLQTLDKENEYYIFLLTEDLDKVSLVEDNYHKVGVDYKWYGFTEQLKFPSVLNNYKLDLMHFPHFNVPIFYQGKYVVTIHDLIHQHFNMQRASTKDPLTFRLKKSAYHLVFSNAIKRAKKIITVSEFTKKQLMSEWQIGLSKMSVTHEGVEDSFVKLAAKTKPAFINQTLQKFGIKPPFIFYVGNAHPHKNIEGLIQSFLILRKNYQYLQLVLAGKKNYFWQRIEKDFKHQNIIYTDFVTDEELIALLKSAKVYVQPSFEEGFGLPLLEAFVCGCPVVSSKRASLPEVGEQACLYFDPTSISEMSEKIQKVLNTPKLTKQLIAEGLKQYQKFSWERMAQETLNIYRKT